MKAEALITELRAAGVRVIEPRPNGNLYLAPNARLTPELIGRVRAAKPNLLAHLRAEQDGAHRWRPLPEPGHPAYSILETCQGYGVALRIDPDGDLVVGKAGAKADEPTQPWSELLAQIEAQLEPVARLVEAGWTLKAGFPKQGTA